MYKQKKIAHSKTNSKNNTITKQVLYTNVECQEGVLMVSFIQRRR